MWMRTIAFSIFLLACFSIAKAQEDSASLVPGIRASADSMAATFFRKDYRTFSTYNNATLVEMLGGEESFANFIEKQMSALGGMTFTRIYAGRILRVIPSAKPMQCIVEQCSEILYQGNYISAISHLVGISTDGREWRFADGNSDSGRDIRTLIPELSPELIIPKKKQVLGVRLEDMLKNYVTAY